MLYRSGGNVEQRMENEAALLNTWWNHNCAVPMMDVPASLGRAWSGLGSHARFTHFPRNVVHVQSFIEVIP